MKEVKHYICEICHTEYANEDEAWECEKTHKTPTKICQAIYKSMNADLLGYPQKIEVMMSDGQKVWFKRVKSGE